MPRSQPKWFWDARALAEFEEARSPDQGGSALAGDVSSALEELRLGRTGPADKRGRIFVLAVHSEPPCCVLYAAQQLGLLLGLHLALCGVDSVPESAFVMAENRFDRPDLDHR